MKALILLVWALAPSFCHAQLTLDPTTKKYSMEAIVEAKSRGRAELMKRAKYWFLSRYPESVLHLDTANGKMIGVGVFLLEKSMGGTPVVRFTILVDFKPENIGTSLRTSGTHTIW
ncbi:MAG TPA: hypothetical protein VGD31_10320 [Sphingobacteriaceae bacterium]